jgi:hypothetical protein
VANYFFDKMTQAQADTYQKKTDIIVFRVAAAATSASAPR